MRYFLGNISVEIFLFFLVSVRLRPAVLDEVIVDPILKRNGIGYCRFLALVDGVEDLKYFPSN